MIILAQITIKIVKFRDIIKNNKLAKNIILIRKKID